MMTTDNLVLRPNCLLTRSPLVFLSGPRSLFSPRKMAADLQDFVLAHGYQVESVWLPFRGPQRKTALEQWLQQNKARSFHFFMAEATWQEMQNILEKNFHPLSTLNIVNMTAKTPRSHLNNAELIPFEVTSVRPPLAYQFHRLFSKAMGSTALPFEQTLQFKDPTLYDRFLDRCIELAENEYKDLTSRM